MHQPQHRHVPYSYNRFSNDYDDRLFPSPCPSPPFFTTPNYIATQSPSRVASPYSPYSFDFSDPSSPYMTSPSQNPPIRIQESTPNVKSSPFTSSTSSPMLATTQLAQHPQQWAQNFESTLLLPFPERHLSINPGYRAFHKRFSSSSSIGSAGPDSPYTQTSLYPRIVDIDSSLTSSPHLDSCDGAYSGAGQPAKPFVPSSNSALQDSLFSPAFRDFNPSTCDEQHILAYQEAMKQAMEDERRKMVRGEDRPPTSMVSYPDYDRAGGENARQLLDRSNVPSLDRTMSEVYEDELYNPSFAAAAPVSSERDGRNVTSIREPSVFLQRLQAAKERHLSARSASPVATSNISRERAPFGQNPDFASDGYSNTASNAADTAASRLEGAVSTREQERTRDYQRANMQRDLGPSTTISPKDAVLDYDETEEAAKMPLIPQENLQKRENQFTSRNPNTRHLSRSDADNNNNSQRNYGNPQTSRRQKFSSPSSSSTTPIPAGSHNHHLMPSLPGNVQMPKQYPFIANRRQSSSVRSASDPDFSAPLLSMESTKSEGSQPEPIRFTTETNTATRSPSSPSLQRPADTTAASGPYSCNLPGCTQRFDAGSKLQKHRKEFHHQPSPQPTPVTPTPSASSAASAPGSNTGAAANRNSQAGPHKCERMNPSTNKPCNTAFSRSYDLTRHEDTIHNNRKQKVRCTHCQEEKTFSRNDALTRHMRVVHPEVDFPGKNKRPTR